MDQPVDFVLSTHIDATGGLVQDQNLGLSEHPLAQNHFLLIAAGKGCHTRIHGTGLDQKILSALLRSLQFLVGIQQPSGQNCLQIGRNNSQTDAVQQIQA